jgi:hypothetical protein
VDVAVDLEEAEKFASPRQLKSLHLNFKITHLLLLPSLSLLFAAPASRVSSPSTTTTTATALFAENSNGKPIERGVSVDQDGKSNVWAIEPKMEVSTKSSEEKTQSALIAGGGLVAFAAAAGFILTNLPDPNQF